MSKSILEPGLFEPIKKKTIQVVDQEQNTLIIKDFRFLIERDEHNNFKTPYTVSATLIEELKQQFGKIILLFSATGISESPLASYPEITVISLDLGETFNSVKQLLEYFKKELNVKFNLPRQIRRVTWINFDNFIEKESLKDITFVDTHDHGKIHVTTPKDLSFNDLAKMRNQRSWI